MLLLLPILAHAGDSWSDPFPGVRLLERTVSGSSDQHVTAAYVDVCADGMHARATTYDERRQTTSAWAESVGALVAVNGAFFSYTDYDAIGWSIGDGETWPTAVDDEHYTAVAFASHGRVELFDPEVALPPLGEDWWREMVPGDPLLVDDGVVVEENCYSHMCEDHPRSAVGIAADGRTVLLVAVDGRSSSADGMTRQELAELMLDLGAWRALNLDGGGSTTLYVQGQGVVNEPSDGSERTVASHLGFTLDLDEPGCCIPEAVEGASGVFGDIPDDDWVQGYAEALYAAGVTTGCQSDPLLFCPDCVLDRAHLGVLVARAMGLAEADGASFADVDADDWAAPWLEALLDAGVTSGCGSDPLLYCPDRIATRWEAAAFVFRGMGLAEVTPTGRFTDLSDAQAAVVEALAQVCVVSGCGEDSFCPDREITRGEAAAMLALGFSLGEYHPCEGDDTGATDDTGGTPDSGGTGATDGDDTGAHPEGRGTTTPAAEPGCGCRSSAAVAWPILLLGLRRRR